MEAGLPDWTLLSNPLNQLGFTLTHWQMLKQPGLFSLVLHLSVLKCNCRTYNDNISLKLNAPYRACLGRPRYIGPRYPPTHPPFVLKSRSVFMFYLLFNCQGLICQTTYTCNFFLLCSFQTSDKLIGMSSASYTPTAAVWVSNSCNGGNVNCE